MSKENTQNQDVMRHRLRAILDGQDLTDRDIALKIPQMTPQNFSNYLTGQRPLTDKFLDKFSRALGIPFEMAKYGKGLSEYLAQPDNELLKEPGFFAEGNTASVRPNLKQYYVEVPFLSAKAQAGIPALSYENFSLKWIEETYSVFLPAVAITERHIVIEIVGDSMEDEIKDGALVLAEAVRRDDIKYESGGVYAVLYGSSRFVVKRIKTNNLMTNGTLQLWSDNEKYGHINVHSEDILFMWKILGKVWETLK